MSLGEIIIYDTEAAAIKAIHEGADVNEHDRYGFRPLIQAVICKKISVLFELLQAGADIEQGDFIDRTALQWACDRSELDICEILLKAGANPNHYSADGQPILVNPILREQMEFIELFRKYDVNYQFAQDYISAKLLGHRFELTGEADIVSTAGKFIPLSFEGFNLEFTTDLLARSLNNFLNSIPGQKFTEYLPRLQSVLNALKNAAQLTEYGRHKDKTPFQADINEILNNSLLLLPSAYQGHAITFIKYGDYWAKCDRGVGKIANTVVVSTMGNPYAADRALYNKVLYEHKTQEFVREEIANILKLKTLTTLPTKHQISGNCSWANVETSVPTMLYILSINPQIHRDMASLAQLQRDVYQFYKAWVDWDQDNALDEALQDFTSADEVRKISKAIILGGILVQRCNPKYSHHVARAKKILSILTLPSYSFILDNYCKVFCNQRAGKAGERVQKLFKACGLNIAELTLNKQVNYSQTDVLKTDVIRMTTALHVACLQGNFDLVKQLLTQANIDVDYIDRTGSTALMYAAYAGHLNIVKYLVEQGADVTIKNLKGGTATRYAAYAGHRDIAEYLKSVR